jgi:hypothetical protein
LARHVPALHSLPPALASDDPSVWLGTRSPAMDVAIRQLRDGSRTGR